MAHYGTPVQNQLGFHEYINIIDDASGPIYLDLEISTIHVIKPVSDISIYIESLDIQNPIPKNKYLNLTLIILPKINGINLSFDPTFIWLDSRLYDIKIPLYINTILKYDLYSIDSGTYWRISSSGIFGPDYGYSLIDTTSSNTTFNGLVSTSFTDNSKLDNIEFLEFLKNIKFGSGKITLTAIENSHFSPPSDTLDEENPNSPDLPIEE